MSPSCHCGWVSELWHLSSSFTVVSWGQLQPHTKKCFDGLEKRVQDELGPRSLEVDTISNLVEHLEWKERDCWISEGKAKSIQNFNLNFLRTLHSWSQVLNQGTKLSFLDFVNMIIVESLRA